MSDTRRFIELDAKARMAVQIVLVVLPLTAGATAWSFMQLWDHGNRITAIENSRYTRDMADEERRVAEGERRDLERVLIRLDTRTAEIDKKLEQLLENR